MSYAHSADPCGPSERRPVTRSESGNGQVRFGGVVLSPSESTNSDEDTSWIVAETDEEDAPPPVKRSAARKRPLPAATDDNRGGKRPRDTSEGPSPVFDLTDLGHKVTRDFWRKYLNGFKTVKRAQFWSVASWLRCTTLVLNKNQCLPAYNFNNLHYFIWGWLFRIQFKFNVTLELWSDETDVLYWVCWNTSTKMKLAQIRFSSTIAPLVSQKKMYTGAAVNMMAVFGTNHLFDQCSLFGLFAFLTRFVVVRHRAWRQEDKTLRDDPTTMEALILAQAGGDRSALDWLVALIQ